MLRTVSSVVVMAASSFLSAQGFEAPVRINAGDAPIDVDVGHAAPFVADLDGDGKNDLLVGQFGEGKLRVYKNIGDNKAPKFKDFEWLKAGGDIARVPTG